MFKFLWSLREQGQTGPGKWLGIQLASEASRYLLYGQGLGAQPPAGSRGGAHCGGLGGEVPRNILFIWAYSGHPWTISYG